MLSFHNGGEGSLHHSSRNIFRIKSIKIKGKKKLNQTFRSLTAAIADYVCDSEGRLYAINGNGLLII